MPLNLSLVAATLWNVWKARNQAIFRGKAPVALAIIDSAHATIKSYTRWNPGKSRGRNRGNVEAQRGTARTRYVAPPAEGNSEPYESQPQRGAEAPGEDGGMAYREIPLRRTQPSGILYDPTNCSYEQRGVDVVDSGGWMEKEDPQPGEPGSKTAGRWKAFCSGMTEEQSVELREAQVAGLGCGVDNEGRPPSIRVQVHRST